MGAEGVISVASNLLPKQVSGFVRSALAGEFAKALKQHRTLYPVFKALFVEPNPVPVKAALAEAGILSSSEVRLPLCEMSPDSAKILFAALASFRR